jgi:hypothetical protein
MMVLLAVERWSLLWKAHTNSLTSLSDNSEARRHSGLKKRKEGGDDLITTTAQKKKTLEPRELIEAQNGTACKSNNVEFRRRTICVFEKSKM